MKLVSIVVLSIMLPILSVKAINWQTGGWAMQCDFKNRDFATKNNMPGSQCGGLCVKTTGCTHFTWNTYNGGTCWMKNGAVSRNDAFATSDPSMVCGIVSSSNTAPINPIAGMFHD